MTQEERWLKRYEEVVGFIETNKRNPSKHRIEDHDMLNWLKANKKFYTVGEQTKIGWRILQIDRIDKEVYT